MNPNRSINQNSLGKADDIKPISIDTTYVRPKADNKGSSSGAGSGSGINGHATRDVPEFADEVTRGGEGRNGDAGEQLKKKKGNWFLYMKTKQFWIVLALGYATHFSHEFFTN